jgi:hypothetical protein
VSSQGSLGIIRFVMGFGRPALGGLLVIALFLSSPAVAEPTEAERLAAQRDLKEGNQLFALGEYQRALERYQAAYQRVPSVKLFFNFGQAYRQLGRDVEAAESYERFLAESPDTPSEVRREAQQHLGAMLGRIGYAQVSADVDGADVLVDGRSHGPTPLRGPIRLTPGPHQVVVQAKPGPPYLERIEVEARKTVLVKARFADRAVPAAAPQLRSAPVALVRTRREGEAPPLRRVGQIAVAAGVVMAVAGGVVLATSWAKYADATDGGCLKKTPTTCEDDARLVARRNTQSLILLGGAAVAGVLGGVLWYVSPLPGRGEVGLRAGAGWTF